VSEVGTTCTSDGAVLSANVCNRGTLPVPSGLAVAFEQGRDEACRAETAVILGAGECARVECTADVGADPVLVELVADADATVGECHEANNRGRLQASGCP
jgi:hypothetical protein